MATISSLLPATFALGFQPACSSTQSPAFPAIATRSKLLRFGRSSRNVITSTQKKRVLVVFASNIDPTEGKDVSGKSDGKRMHVADSPPLPTILAGVLVFLLISWVVGSIVMWLIGLIINPPQP